MRHLNFLADCRTAATMKTSRDNRLMRKRLCLFIIFKKRQTSTESGGAPGKKDRFKYWFKKKKKKADQLLQRTVQTMAVSQESQIFKSTALSKEVKYHKA